MKNKNKTKITVSPIYQEKKKLVPMGDKPVELTNFEPIEPLSFLHSNN